MKLHTPSFFLLLAFIFFQTTQAQLISRFDFNSTATIKTATFGDDATFVSPDAAAPAGIGYITAGCGAGVGMDLTVPGATFDVFNISITCNFRRGAGEGTGSFFKRGPFDFGFAGGKVVIAYDTDDGFGGTFSQSFNTGINVITGGFQDYGYSYDNCSGVSTVYVNSVAVWTNDGPDNRDLTYGGGNPDVLISSNVDNSCSSFPGMDYIYASGNAISCVLPVEWASFSVESSKAGVNLIWETAYEMSNDFFTVERAINGDNFIPLTDIPSQGVSNTIQSYAYMDPVQVAGEYQYRIKQTDLDGKTSYSQIQSVNFNPSGEGNIKVYPNPSTGVINLQNNGLFIEQVDIINLQGQVVHSIGAVSAELSQIDLTDLAPGVYFVKVDAGKTFHTIKFIKN